MFFSPFVSCNCEDSFLDSSASDSVTNLFFFLFLIMFVNFYKTAFQVSLIDGQFLYWLIVFRPHHASLSIEVLCLEQLFRSNSLHDDGPDADLARPGSSGTCSARSWTSLFQRVLRVIDEITAADGVEAIKPQDIQYCMLFTDQIVRAEMFCTAFVCTNKHQPYTYTVDFNLFILRIATRMLHFAAAFILQMIK